MFICEKLKWENVPVGGGSQYMNTFFFFKRSSRRPASSATRLLQNEFVLVFDYVRPLTHTPTLISHDSEVEFFPLGHIRQLEQRILFD